MEIEKLKHSLPLATWKLEIKSHWRKVLAIVVVAVVAFGLVVFYPRKNTPSAQAAWYASDGKWWSYRQEITLNPTHDKVPNTSQTDFPVLIKITDAGNTVFDNAQGDADDILFTSSNATTKLSHEIERFDTTGHELDAWVKIPTLSTGADTIIYMYYGNASATSQQDVANVWSSSFAITAHHKEASGAISDSSGHYTGTSSNLTYAQTGKIGLAHEFNGTISDISWGDVTQLNSASQFTVDLWLNQDILDQADTIFTKQIDATSRVAITTAADGNMYFDVSNGTSQSGYFDYSTAVSAGSWAHIAAVYNGGGATDADRMKLYVNGTSRALTFSAAIPATTVDLSGNNAYEGYSSGALDGKLDEVRLASTARLSDWIVTEYNNQNDPSTFFSLDAEATGDIVAPTNPTSFTGKNTSGGSTTLTTGNFYNFPTPYFEWPAAEAVGGAADTGNTEASGVAGYYLYFGTTCGGGGADPATTRGVLTDTGGGVHYQTGINVTVPDLTTNEGTYCLRIKAKDNAGNISSAYQAFVYKYDQTAPDPVAYVAASPSGYTGTNSFTFSWPASNDHASVGQSGLAGYQYKRDNGEEYSATTASTSVAGIASYQTGTNVFYVRTIDNAGNTSAGISTNYYYSNSAPLKPGNLAVLPVGESATNSFSFSWDAPVNDLPIVDYGYTINVAPSGDNLTWLNSATTSLAAGAYATQQGTNIFYLVAKDGVGNYSTDAASVAQINFECVTSAPPAPTDVSISDSSNRVTETWSLTVKWAAGAGQVAGSLDHYSIERSTDNSTFSEIGTTTSTSYIDATGLNNSTTYYYRIRAVDNADNPSVYSTTASRKPTGKYTAPPSFVGEPTVSVKSSQVTVSWVTDRVSSSIVRFGTDSGDLGSTQGQLDSVTNHSVTIDGLTSSTKYYYQVQSLDDDRDYADTIGYSSTYNFTTTALPVISNVESSNITLNSADITWETSTATSATLKYGSSISYGQQAEGLSDSFVSKHTIKLENLIHSTTYHFKITCTDEESNGVASDDYVFETQKMPQISSVSYQEDTTGPETVVKIEWKTNVPTTSSIEYFPEDGSAVINEETKSAMTESHQIELRGLKDSTVYSFTVSGRDQFGNEVKSDQTTLKTKNDSRLPKITNVVSETSNIGSGSQNESKVIVSWKTDEPSTSQVEFAEGITGESYTSSTQKDSTMTNSHLVIISGLKDREPYHMRVCSADKANNLACSTDNTFIPGEVKRSVMVIVLNALKKAFGWTGNFIK